MPKKPLSEQVLVVTGASSGLGRHFAEVLSLSGAKVAVAARRMDMLTGVCQSIRERGGSAIPIQLDVTVRLLGFSVTPGDDAGQEEVVLTVAPLADPS